MPILNEVSINDDSYNDPSFTTEWIDVSSANNLVFTSYCSQNYDVGYALAVDSNHFIIKQVVNSVLAGESFEYFLPVEARFIQFFVNNIAANPCQLKCQGFFFLESGGEISGVINGGIGESLVIGPVGYDTELKGLVAGSNITLTPSATDITISSASTNVTLTSAGAGNTIVVDDVGPSLSVKSISAGVGIVLTPTANDISITSTGSSPFQQIGAEITPVTATTTSLVGGLTNQIDASSKNALVWGENNSTIFTNSSHTNVGIIACETSGITGPFGEGRNMGAIFCKDCYCVTAGGNGDTLQVGFVASELCETYDAGGGDRSCQRCATIAAYNCRIGGVGSVTRDSLQCLIGSSQNCVMDNYSGTCCSTILSCNNCQLGTGTPGGADADQLCMMGCTGCTLGVVDNNARDTDSILSSKGCAISGETRNGTILNSDGCSMYGIEQFKNVTNSMINCTDSDITAIFAGNGQCTRNAMINTKSSSIRYDDNVYLNCTGVTGTHKGNLVAGDSVSGFISESDDQCLMKFNNGYKFYTNGALTTGMVAGAGANSFSAICQRKFKENIEEIMYDKILNLIEELPVFMYNYKGNNPLQMNISPMAEDWHNLFGFLDGGMKDDGVIETMDAIGICLSGLKGIINILNRIEDSCIQQLDGQYDDVSTIIEGFKIELDKIGSVKKIMSDDLSYLASVVLESQKKILELYDKIDDLENVYDKLLEEVMTDIDKINCSIKSTSKSTSVVKNDNYSRLEEIILIQSKEINDMKKRISILELQH
jgi:hypothetical protein